MLKKGSTWFSKEREMFDCFVCVCVCVWWAFVWACKRETERESKKRINLIFKREREREKNENSFNLIFDCYELLKEREKKLISLHWKNLFLPFVKTYFPISTSIQQMALHWSILNFFKFSFKTHIINETKTFSLI
jgi:hypothetical protein